MTDRYVATVDGITYSLSPTERKVLRYLRGASGVAPYARAIALVVWPDSPGWSTRSHRHDGNGGAMGVGPTMRMGVVLSGLWKAGLVRRQGNGWVITNRGIAAIGLLP